MALAKAESPSTGSLVVSKAGLWSLEGFGAFIERSTQSALMHTAHCTADSGFALCLATC
jgi:hypothetical protein